MEGGNKRTFPLNISNITPTLPKTNTGIRGVNINITFQNQVTIPFYQILLSFIEIKAYTMY